MGVAEYDISLIAVIALAVLFIAWYYVGFAYNRRQARRVGRELRPAVLALGGTTTIRWFGTSAFRMTTTGANAPFKEVSLTVTMRPREMPINWAVDSAQGRRDTALIEASLRVDPGFGFELVNPQSRVGRRRMRARSAWVPMDLGGRSFLLATEADRKTRRFLDALDPEFFTPIAALHVTSGSQPGIAASVSVERGTATQGLTSVRTVAERLAA